MDIRSLIQKAKEVCKRTFKVISKIAKTHKIATAAVSAVTIMVMLMSMVLIKNNNVEIYVDGVLEHSFSTLKEQPEEWLAHAGVELNDGDVLNVTGTRIDIDRAFYVTVKADGVETTFKTVACTVQNALDTAEVEVGDSDTVNLMPEKLITKQTVIEVTRIAKDTVTKTETIDYETKEQKTDKLYKGETEVKTKGEKGKIKYTYEVTYTDGEETDRKLVSKEVVKEPVDKVVLVGTKEKPKVTTSSTPTSYKKVYTMRASAYTYGEDGGNVTATGIRPYKGIVAVDPKVIPLGTKLYIETADGSYVYGTAVAADTGSAIKGNKIDLFLESESACNRFGRRTVNVYVLN